MNNENKKSILNNMDVAESAFLPRKDFISKTGIMVSPERFRWIAQDYNESNIQMDMFITNWVEGVKDDIVTITSDATLRFLMDDVIADVAVQQHVDDPRNITSSNLVDYFMTIEDANNKKYCYSMDNSLTLISKMKSVIDDYVDECRDLKIDLELKKLK